MFSILVPISVFAVRIPGVKIYGNWCGPNHGSGKPISALDNICMVHDKCYNRYGYFNCKCDMVMVRAIGRLSSRKLRIIGSPMKSYFRGSPCQGPMTRPTMCGWLPCIKCKKTWIATRLKSLIGSYTC